MSAHSGRRAVALAAVLGLSFGAAVVVGGRVGLPGGAPPPRAPSVAAAPARSAHPLPGRGGELEVLRRAVEEAHSNCLVASLIEEGLGPARSPQFATASALAALETRCVQAAAYGELPSIERELRWLASLDPGNDLGGRTWEDVRFLLGGVHRYLELALAREDRGAVPHPHAIPAAAYAHHAMKEFRGLDFADLLGLWD